MPSPHWLILMKYRWRRFANSQQRFYGRKKGSKLLVVIMAVAYTLMAFNQSNTIQEAYLPALSYDQYVDGEKSEYHDLNMCDEVKDWTASVPLPGKDGGVREFHFSCVKAQAALHQTIPVALNKMVGLQLSLLFLAIVFMTIATREITAPEWDLEWLATLPVPMRTLIDARILQNAFFNPIGLLLTLPFCIVFMLNIGSGWWSLPLGLGLGGLVNFAAGICQTLLDTGLRLFTKPSTTRNLQALLAIVFPLALMAVMSPMMKLEFLQNFARTLPDAFLWSPFALMVAFITTTDVGYGLLRGAVLAAQLFGLYYLGTRLLIRHLSRGVVAGSGWQTAGPRQRSAGLPRKAGRRSAGQPWLGAVARKELALLWRDKNYLMQTFLVPVVVLGAQLAITGVHHKILSGPFSYGAIAAFSCASYVLMLSALQVVIAERQSLWLTYTLPEGLPQQFMAKLRLWGSLALVICGALLALRWGFAPTDDSRSLLLAIVALVGIPIYTLIAGSIGILHTDPLHDDPRKRLSFSSTFVFMNLTGFYAFALLAEDYTTTASIVLLAALTAFALWQKARQRMPYLLDPTASPPPRVMLADGLLASFGFYAIHSITMISVMIVMGISNPDLDTQQATVIGLKALTIGFFAGGLIVFALYRWRFWREKTLWQPRLWPSPDDGSREGSSKGNRVLEFFKVVVPWTAICCGFAAGYMALVESQDWFSEARAKAEASKAFYQEWWYVAMTVVAAPLFEEFVYRGMVFASLARSMKGRLWLAIAASAALFALLHPGLAILPVFLLGIATAIAYQRTGALAAPIAIHVIYNIASLLLV